MRGTSAAVAAVGENGAVILGVNADGRKDGVRASFGAPGRQRKYRPLEVTERG